MNETEIIVAVLSLIGALAGVGFVYKHNTKANEDTQENTATANVFTGYSGLLDRVERHAAGVNQELGKVKDELAECSKAREEMYAFISNEQKLKEEERRLKEEMWTEIRDLKSRLNKLGGNGSPI